MRTSNLLIALAAVLLPSLASAQDAPRPALSKCNLSKSRLALDGYAWLAAGRFSVPEITLRPGEVIDGRAAPEPIPWTFHPHPETRDPRDPWSVSTRRWRETPTSSVVTTRWPDCSPRSCGHRKAAAR